MKWISAPREKYSASQRILCRHERQSKRQNTRKSSHETMIFARIIFIKLKRLTLSPGNKVIGYQRGILLLTEP